MNTTAAELSAELSDDEIIVESKLLGPLGLPTSQIYTFRDELYGFPEATRFALIPTERDGLLWLQSLEFDTLTFLMIDPFLFVEDYSVDLGKDDYGVRQSEDPSEVLVLSILTLPREPGGATTANLQGPIVLNIVERSAKQVVIESSYGTRHPVTVSHA